MQTKQCKVWPVGNVHFRELCYCPLMPPCCTVSISMFLCCCVSGWPQLTSSFPQSQVNRNSLLTFEGCQSKDRMASERGACIVGIQHYRKYDHDNSTHIQLALSNLFPLGNCQISSPGEHKMGIKHQSPLTKNGLLSSLWSL